MATLSTTEKQSLEKLFGMSSGYVLNFTDRTFREFFQNDMNVDISKDKYNYDSGSKANRLRCFWMKESDEVVGKSILKLTDYIVNEISIENLKQVDYPDNRLKACIKIAERLLGGVKASISHATFNNGNINIELQKDIFNHVQSLLDDGHYFNAVEEAYKIVRKKLRDVTGKERATDAFAAVNIEKIFGRQPLTDVERDFCEGVKFLHMAIQFLRNEKAHTPANTLDKNLAIHYISLASLAYDLINRKLP